MLFIKALIRYYGGELGIRTPGRDKPSTVFKTAAFDRSASSPTAAYYYRKYFKIQRFLPVHFHAAAECNLL